MDVMSVRQRVQALLQQLVGTAPGQDPAGNWVLPSGSARVMVNVAQSNLMAPPVVVVASPLLAQVPASFDLLSAINQLNAQLSFVRAYWVNGYVLVSAELLAETVDAPELAMVISQVAQVADAYDDQLRGRFGGALPFAPGAVPAGPLGPQAGPVTDTTLLLPPTGTTSHQSPSTVDPVPFGPPPVGVPIPPPPAGEPPTVTD